MVGTDVRGAGPPRLHALFVESWRGRSRPRLDEGDENGEDSRRGAGGAGRQVMAAVEELAVARLHEQRKDLNTHEDGQA